MPGLTLCADWSDVELLPMPTNKLWLEHTEKAAWESVQALREKVADLEKRVQRLAPPSAGWQPLLDAIDSAKSELGLSGESYAALLGELVAESRRAHGERRALEQELNDLRSQSLMREIASAPRATSRRTFDSGIDDDVSERESPRDEIVARFLRLYESSKRETSADLDELFEAIDAKVADLSDLDERSLPEAALELAALLVRAAKSAQQSQK